MDTIQLENQWNTIEIIDEKGISYVRIDGESIPDLYIAVNNNSHRCLMLKLAKGYATSFKGEEKENIKTLYSEKGNYILLELLDDYYHSLFNDLIISLYFKIRDISDKRESTNTFITTINKWSSFLENSRSSKLSKDVIKGLYGELTVLKEYLQNASENTVNETLFAWRGPYNTPTDFIFENKNEEVKTTSLNASSVKISSEYQLDDEEGKSLNLTVVSVELNNTGETIQMVFNQLRDLILSLNGDQTILSDTFAQKGLFPSNLQDYDDYKFDLKAHTVYDCDAIIDSVTFPSVKKSQLPDNLKNIRYEINLNGLEEFIIIRKDF